MNPLPAHIGPYRVLGPLGGGGFAEVLLGEDTRPHFQGAFVALKRVRPDLRGRGDLYRRSLLTEGRIAQALCTPHMVRVSDMAFCEGEPVVVMEYIPGFGLDALLTHYAGRGIPGHWVGVILLQLTRALKALHGPGEIEGPEGRVVAPAGFVHQDLKPSNIRVTPGGVVKVLDLGIAAPAQAPLERIRQGTPGYRSPEQVEGARSLSPASDLYTLGILGFELSTGKRLFPESLCHDQSTLLDAQRNIGPRLGAADAEGILPVGLRPILEALLAHRPRDRVRNAQRAEAMLRGWVGPRAGCSLDFAEWCEGRHLVLEGADPYRLGRSLGGPPTPITRGPSPPTPTLGGQPMGGEAPILASALRTDPGLRSPGLGLPPWEATGLLDPSGPAFEAAAFSLEPEGRAQHPWPSRAHLALATLTALTVLALGAGVALGFVG